LNLYSFFTGKRGKWSLRDPLCSIPPRTGLGELFHSFIPRECGGGIYAQEAHLSERRRNFYSTLSTRELNAPLAAGEEDFGEKESKLDHDSPPRVVVARGSGPVHPPRDEASWFDRTQ
jgi:hypothetical protein